MESYGQLVVLITGFLQGGIGHALAREFAANNFLVNVVSNVVERYGRDDILVNNAGIQCVGPLAEIPLSAAQNTFDTNVFVLGYDFDKCLADLFILLHRFFSYSEKVIWTIRKKGKILNVGSAPVSAPLPWAGVYTATKAALHSLTDNMRLELRPFGIQVINVVPEAVKSNIGNSAISSYNHMPEWRLYKPFEAAIWNRACLFQGPKITPTEEFAKKTVATVLKKNPPAWFSCGQFSTILSIMYHLPLYVKDYESVQNAVSNVVERYGRVDILVNNAGIRCFGPLAEIPLSATQNTSDPNIDRSHDYSYDFDYLVCDLYVDSIIQVLSKYSDHSLCFWEPRTQSMRIVQKIFTYSAVD
ncbi:hypothetical protein POTOM_018895 [Populus tomentosa]|uniref:Uncharacterized protein n=1 Tax=Populus tomentosa TaxID=118781 RepID=A0A8X8D4F0_POPTO|nr:hypothetical protein POTOM_018895 [Populus tomentosa]